MKIKRGFSLKQKNGEYVIICDKSINRDYTSAIQLTDTSVFLWKLLESGECSKEQMLNKLLEKYDISTVLALNNIDVFVRTLKENGIIE